MKSKKLNASRIWKQFEDLLVPRLRFSIADRAVYSHLLRHSRLEGRTRLRFSMSWLCRGARLSITPVRWAVRRLIAHGALRLLERSKAGHVVEVRLPDEIRATRLKMIRRRDPSSLPRLRAGLPENQGSGPRHPCAGARTLFLLPASAYPYDSLPRSRCPTRLFRQQFLS